MPIGPGSRYELKMLRFSAASRLLRFAPRFARRFARERALPFRRHVVVVVVVIAFYYYGKQQNIHNICDGRELKLKI